ncbi:hypothetical protein U1Q18_048798 [Sarracenia purpurea var. burkii]
MDFPDVFAIVFGIEKVEGCLGDDNPIVYKTEQGDSSEMADSAHHMFDTSQRFQTERIEKLQVGPSSEKEIQSTRAAARSQEVSPAHSSTAHVLAQEKPHAQDQSSSHVEGSSSSAKVTQIKKNIEERA